VRAGEDAEGVWGREGGLAAAFRDRGKHAQTGDHQVYERVKWRMDVRSGAGECSTFNTFTHPHNMVIYPGENS
jgi:hypothetical protein